jgi:hypothetical protein
LKAYSKCPNCNTHIRNSKDFGYLIVKWRLYIREESAGYNRTSRKPTIDEEYHPIVMCNKCVHIYLDRKRHIITYIDLQRFIGVRGNFISKEDGSYIIKKAERLRYADFHSITGIWNGQHNLKHPYLHIKSYNTSQLTAIAVFEPSRLLLDDLSPILQIELISMFNQNFNAYKNKIRFSSKPDYSIEYAITTQLYPLITPWDFSVNEDNYDGIKVEEWDWEEI